MTTSFEDPAGPRGVLVIDGERLSIAYGPEDVRPVDLAAEPDVVGDADAVVLRHIRRPRRQRVGVEAFALGALHDLPFYALAETLEASARKSIAALLTPEDRWLRLAGSDAPHRAGEIEVADDAVPTLLAAAFRDLAARPARPEDAEAPASARQRAKWHFAEIREALGARLKRLSRARFGADRRMTVANYRCGEGAWSIAVEGAGAHYVGVETTAALCANARSRFPEGKFVGLDELAGSGISGVEILLLSDLDLSSEGVARAALERLAGIAARRTIVLALLPFRGLSPAGSGTIQDLSLTGLSTAIDGAFGAPSELRRVATIAHKPLDARPGTIFAEFEVLR